MRVLLLHNKYNQLGGEDMVVESEYAALQNLLGKEYVYKYVIKTNPNHKWKILKSVFYSTEQYKHIYELVKTHKIDIVHIHNYFPLLTVSVFKAASDAGAKVIHTVHNFKLWCIAGTFYRDQIGICTLCTKPNNMLSGIHYKCYRNSLIQSAVSKFAFWNYKQQKLLKYIDKMIVLSNFQLELFTSLGIQKEKMILKPNMVHFIPSTINILEKKNFLFVGRLEYAKGIDFLLKSWRALPSTFILTIIGTGSLEMTLRNEYASFTNIKFLGELNKTEVEFYIQSAKFTVQPSLWFETFGLTIIESMILGTPVIGLNIGNRSELIKSGKNGLLSNEEDFVQTIFDSQKLVDYEKMCQNAVSSALKYLPEQIIQEQVNIYKSVLN